MRLLLAAIATVATLFVASQVDADADATVNTILRARGRQ